MPILISFIVVYCLGNAYILVRGLQFLSFLPLYGKWIFGIIYFLLSSSLISMVFMRNGNIQLNLAHDLYQVGTGWLVFTLYMVIALLFFDLLRLCHFRIPGSYLIALVITLGTLAYGYWHYKHPSVNVVDINMDKKLTNDVKSLKIVGVSDIHIGYGTEKKDLAAYVDLINAQNPDLILIAGDLIDFSIYPVKEGNMDEELSRLKAPLGVYMALGNHEYVTGIENCLAFIEKTPIHLLRDEMITLPNGIQLVGRDDRTNKKRASFAESMKGIDLSLPVIVLDHQPYETKEAQTEKVDLLFCGHTHHGQVWPMSWLVDAIYDIGHGYAKRESTNIYVSSGLSLWGPPFRIGTESELTIFNVAFN